ncbi:hypothetical protein Q7P35_011288 [Cladosporium inversicolor]
MSDDDNNIRQPPPSHHGCSSASSNSAAARSVPPPVPRMHLAMDILNTLHRLFVALTVTPRTSKRARLKVAPASRRFSPPGASCLEALEQLKLKFQLRVITDIPHRRHHYRHQRATRTSRTTPTHIDALSQHHRPGESIEHASTQTSDPAVAALMKQKE